MKKGNRQSGFILLVTVIIIAAITSIILAYSRSVELFHLNIQRMNSDIEIDNAMQSCLCFIKDYLNKTENIAGETDFTVSINGYTCNIKLQCENGKININNLVNNSDTYDTAYTTLLARLIEYYNISTDNNKISGDMIAALIDAIDSNNDITSLSLAGKNCSGAEQKYYSENDMAAIPNHKLDNIEDLCFVKGCTTEKLYLRPNEYYRPFINCLTTAKIDKIDINCAPAEIIAALADNISLEDAVSLDVHKKTHGYNSLEDFYQAAEIYSDTTELDGILQTDAANRIYSIEIEAEDHKTRKLKAFAQKDDNDRYNVKELYCN